MTKPLSPRQLDVLRLLADGHPNKIIAHRLGTSEATVKVHLRVIYDRIGATNRVGAVLIAQRRGLLTVPSIAAE